MPESYEGVVGREVRAAGIPEYDVDALRLEAFHDRVDRSHHRCSTSFHRIADGERRV